MNTPEDYGAEVLRQQGMVALRITSTGKPAARVTVNLEVLDGTMDVCDLARVLEVPEADVLRLLAAARTVTAP